MLRLKSAADLLKTQQSLKFFINFLMFLTLLIACEGEERLILNTGSAYFPVQKGIFQVYSVEEVRYNASEAPMTLAYELMAQVVDSFPSGKNQYTYVIHRSTRESDEHLWEALDTWSVRKNGSDIIVSEGNTAYVKIKSPLTVENVWDGNAFNSFGADQYVLKEIDKPLELNGISFSKTLTVEQEYNDDPIVFRDERKEIYARDAGLVYKEIVQLYYCTDDSCLGQQKIDHGIETKMVILEYGKR